MSNCVHGLCRMIEYSNLVFSSKIIGFLNGVLLSLLTPLVILINTLVAIQLLFGYFD